MEAEEGVWETDKVEEIEQTPKEKRRRKRKTSVTQRPKKRGTKIPEVLSFQVGRFYCKDKPVKKDTSILSQCSQYYTDELIESLLIPLITQKHKVSLRSLDWLATNFSKKNYLVYMKFDRQMKTVTQFVNIYNNYDDRLHRNNRKKFDPFRRRTRVYFQYNEDWYETTVGQLWFLKWIIFSGILEYAEAHIEEINQDMSITNEKNKEEIEQAKASGRKRPRKELSKKPSAECVAYRIPRRTKFDDEEEPERKIFRFGEKSIYSEEDFASVAL
jgi:hypothetical protein